MLEVLECIKDLFIDERLKYFCGLSSIFLNISHLEQLTNTYFFHPIRSLQNKQLRVLRTNYFTTK